MKIGVCIDVQGAELYRDHSSPSQVHMVVELWSSQDSVKSQHENPTGQLHPKLRHFSFPPKDCSCRNIQLICTDNDQFHF